MTNSNDAALAEQVSQAFAAAKNGNYELITALANQGSTVIPHLTPYLSDQNEIVRLQAIGLLANFSDPASVPLLSTALADTSQDIRNQAATILYQHYDPNQLAQNAALGQVLQQSVARGNDGAAAILLLSYFPSEDTQQTLYAQATSTGNTELFTWSPVVPVATVSKVALSRLGDSDNRLALLQEIEQGNVATLEFLLGVLREIGSPEVLHSIANATLNNSTEISSGVPSGASPQRRLQDLAVTALVQRLQLGVDFEVSEHKRYSDTEIEQLRQLISNSIPR